MHRPNLPDPDGGSPFGDWFRRTRIRLAVLLTASGAFLGVIVGAQDHTATTYELAVIIGLLSGVPVWLVDGALRRLGHDRPYRRRRARIAVRRPGRRPQPLAEGLSTFRGRQEQLARLLEAHKLARAERDTDADGAPGRARRGGAVLLLVHGKPGVGKSALAQRLAHQLAAEYPDGLVYANFGTARDATPPAELLQKFLVALGWTEEMPRDVGERANLLRALTAKRRVLFIFDAARHPDQVRQVLPAEPGCAVIVTSRRDLGPALNAPSLLLEEPTHDEALDMLRAVARTPGETEPEAAAEIVELCGRLPLAIQSAAERVGIDGTDLRDVADLLRAPHTRLDRLDRGGRSVQERIGSEYKRLLPPEQKALRLLTLVRTRSFVPSVLGALLGISDTEAENRVAALADAQLLDSAGTAGPADRDGGSEPPRYTFNPLVRLYAERKLTRHEATDRREEAQRRLDGAQLDDAGKAQPHHRIALSEPRVRAEYENLVGIVVTAHEHRSWALCWRVGVLLHGCVPHGVDARVVLYAFDRAAGAARVDREPLGHIDVLLAKASFLMSLERYARGFAVLARAHELAAGLVTGDEVLTRAAASRHASAHRRAGEAYLQMGAFHDARAALEQAAGLATAADEQDELRLIRLLQAENHRVLSPDPSYVDMLEGRLEDPVLYRAFLGRAEAARRVGDWPSAEAHLRQAQAHNVADARRSANVNYRLARLHLDQWRQMTPQYGPPRMPAAPVASYADPLAQQALARQAVRRAAQAALAFRQMNNVIGRVRTHCLLVRALAAEGRLVEAEQLCHATERHLRRLRYFAGRAWAPLVARFYRAQGELLLQRSELRGAWQSLVAAATLYGESGDWRSQGATLRLVEGIHSVSLYPPGAALPDAQTLLEQFSTGATLPRHGF